METSDLATVYLASEEDTADLGRWLALRLRAGDCLLLQGPIGAGKSHLARTFIQARLGRMEDVPSPTFTLVQTYQADVEIWHADLYRLSHPDEVAELGLHDAFSQAICLIEWSERLGDLAPRDALRLQILPQGDGRTVSLTSPRHPDLVGEFAARWAK
ncbi:tRNA (adenosine(37)-N6)-threonylcarbamoyltransferase complex ATPase subunit type 1 TsaE [Cypionkella aquatica]|uniref:tRNA threonylcarbamoyladenosine biosynthesis protein TsaE n=1 Tax=Cypionkella aquatica TaxID=1756042 RepID=A0AA37U652_9RHOB|nr:tRNA (adenosine(37)-N6)-threonylcarbamoyltransferase complex ATPase subunit type 1 TsaE [Cypionkella aquatica]GLS86231.1 tRNA (adenosine(37)-N6)-threonylcarbamoyltransferase complex ATPase subunit type 1 TsaE [Cypionkella aquatica]